MRVADFLMRKPIRGEVAFTRPVPDFLPYACHFDDHTLLTKNGELLQIIKIIGFKGQKVGAQRLDLRAEIRKAILQNVKTDNFAIWFHTVRRQKNLDPGGNYPEGFAASLHQAWNNKNGWDRSYVNEVYVSFIRDGAPFTLKDKKNIFRALWFGSLKKYHMGVLEAHARELRQVVDGVLATLADFGAVRLGVVEQDGISYSEPLQFIGKIVNFTELPIPMPVENVSEYVGASKIAFGFNTMQVINSNNKFFGAIFTIKEYHEQTTRVLDRFLQLPQEFVVTQTLDFVNRKQALRKFKRQKYILEVSGDKEFSEITGLDDVLHSEGNTVTDYGESQITILFISRELEGLERDIKRGVTSLSELGIMATRRDLRLEECFWAQLPANFMHLSRKRPINTPRIGGFASLYNYPAGNRWGGPWKEAITIFRTVSETPYFFNFHCKESGHTAIFGPLGSGKTVLLNFLVSEAQKVCRRLFFFDQEKASEVFIRAIGGEYVTIFSGNTTTDCTFNPFMLEDTKENRVFIFQWLYLLAAVWGQPISEQDKALLMKAVEYSFSLPNENRRIGYIAKIFGPVTKGSLGHKLSPWYGNGKYAALFDSDKGDAVQFTKPVYGFCMGDVVKDKVSLGPVLFYLFYRIETLLDGTPGMIVLDEAWNLVNNPVFAPRLAEWLERLKQKNVVVIFATENVHNASKSEITPTITRQLATRIFLPNAEAEKYSIAYKEVWGLSEGEFKMLDAMTIRNRQFMLKQGDDAIVAVLNLAGMRELKILSGSKKTATIMGEVMAQKGVSPNEWLPAFYERISQN